MFCYRTLFVFLSLMVVCFSSANGHSADDAFKLLSATPGYPVIVRPHQYDYVPTIIYNGNTSHIWWCGSVRPGAGDTIFEANVPGLDFERPGAATNIHPVFSNPGDQSKFDGRHVCDPSIIEVSNRMYMYYGGIPESRNKENNLKVAGRVGVAVSDDGGENWTRANQGEAILSPRELQESDNNRYGLGQPSIIYHNGFFYLFYTNTVGPDGVGIYLVRSRHPLMTEAEEWTSQGFIPLKGRTPIKGERFIKGFSADWAYIQKYNMFMMALRKEEGIMQLVFFDETLQRRLGTVDIPIEWTEGPGLVRDESGNLVVLDDQDSVLSFYLLRSTGVPRRPATWDISASKIRLLVNYSK